MVFLHKTEPSSTSPTLRALVRGVQEQSDICVLYTKYSIEIMLFLDPVDKPRDVVGVGSRALVGVGHLLYPTPSGLTRGSSKP